MAFLDNSGDIILDAVLTEKGRKRMSRGNFKITKFAFGDDEINYTQYNKDHASGSAYYDLEILQTPIFEANTGLNANINYGLTNYTKNVLYMPTIKRNQIVEKSAKPISNVYYLAVNDGVTSDALVEAFGGTSGGGIEKVLKAGKTNGTAIMFETGLDTAEIAGTITNKNNYIITNGLQESTFKLSVDKRFFTSVLGPTGGTTFNNSGTSGESNVNVRLTPVLASASDPAISHNNTATITAINNGVVKRLTDTTADTATSVIAGPRGSFTAVNFDIKILAVDEFSRYGKTGQSVPGAAGTYRYIDSTVKIMSPLGMTDQVAIRIIQKE
jgi:hypothetical protein